MPAASTPSSETTTRRSGWIDPRLLLLTVLVFGGYFFRATTMSFRGEEPRRAQVAVEMIERGDWFVPREQGDPFLSRPPFQNWAIALSFLGFGERSVFAARLPSLISTLLTVWLLYGYGRTFLSPNGALAGAASYATFGEIFQTGRMAETEALFILLVAASLLVWHWGFVRNWPGSITWGVSYTLMACGALTKCLQAPFYFGVSIAVYLLITRQVRRAFCLAHLGGIAMAAAILLAWNLPVYREIGGDKLYGIWFNDTGPRLFEWQNFFKHLVVFPAEVFGCTLPWSPLLLAFLQPDFRRRIGSVSPQLLFVSLVLILGFPTCWLPPAGQTRYVAPLYPFIALLVGFVVEKCGEAEPTSAVGIGWRRYLKSITAIMVLAAAALPVAALFPQNRMVAVWIEPLPTACLFILGALGLAWLTWKTTTPEYARRTGLSVAAVAAFMVLLFNGPVLDARVRRGEDTQAAIEKFKQQLPEGTKLLSLGHVHSEFPFFMQETIECVPISPSLPSVIPAGGYFCFSAVGKQRPTLPFHWREETVISVDRNKQPEPIYVIVVGRRTAGEVETADRSTVAGGKEIGRR